MSQAPAAPTTESGQIKETLISVIIAFIMAFVFRAFVIEAFVIPTGSMAPTLLGQHVRVQSAHTGFNWPVGPQQVVSGTTDPLPVQSSVQVHDPMTNEFLTRGSTPTRAGDRILVFKYLYSIYDPKRFDVVVFKAPHMPSDNYIKRLTGLPGEMIALVDGDVFARKAGPGEAIAPGSDPWELPGWEVQRKPDRAQRAVWQRVFSSEDEPLVPVRDENPVTGADHPFRPPWIGGDHWSIDGRREYQYDGSGPTTLSWDNQPSGGSPGRWPITDFCYYNENPQIGWMSQRLFYPVSDVAISCGVRPASGTAGVCAVVRARGHEFRADISGTAVTLRMGALGLAGADGQPAPPAAWTTLATATLARPLEPGRVTDVEFWHADQALSLFIDGTLVARGGYDWTPGQRVQFTLGTSLQTVMDLYAKDKSNNPLANPANYRQPRVWWEFSGGPLTLYRVALSRDIFYQPGSPDPNRDKPPRATHPATTMFLGPDEFFVCGDNSPMSLDARLWGKPEPWVAQGIDENEGVVPRDLMIGRAFFVYFPSLIRGERSFLPVPDFGRMRWIW